MTTNKTEFDDLGVSQETIHPGVTIDCVILGFHEGSLKVLLNKLSTLDKWMLPGGFLRTNENLDDAADRILRMRTNLDDIYLRQFHTFGNISRTSKEEDLKILELMDPTRADSNHWFLNRFLTIGYYALVKTAECDLQPLLGEDKAQWFDVNKVPRLYADHNRIINKAIENIRMEINYIPVGYELLPEKFTMPELRIIYETILGKELDRRNFQRKMLSMGYIIRLNETRKSGAHKAPRLYSFDKKKYDVANEFGLQIMSWNMQESF